MINKILTSVFNASVIVLVFCLSTTNVFALTLNNQQVEFSGVKDDAYTQLLRQAVQKQQNNEAPLYIDDQVLVKFNVDDVDLFENTGILKKMKLDVFGGIDVHKELVGVNVIVYDIQDGKTVEEKIRELENDSNVVYAQPNYILKPFAVTTDDADFGNEWAAYNSGQTVNGVVGTADADMDVTEAWDIADGTASDVVVAVLDSGVAYNHPDLIDNMWDGSGCVDPSGDTVVGGCTHGYDVFDDDVDPRPDNVDGGMHGTHISGIIAATDNAIGVIGVNPHTKIMAVKTMGYITGYGVVATSEDFIEGMDFARRNNADIVNFSGGGFAESQAEQDAITAFPGLVVVAVGNAGTDNDSGPVYPASYSNANILSVAATDQDDELAYFSNYGENSVDVGAPGVNIYSTTVYSENIYSEDVEGAVSPGVPNGFTAAGTFGTEDDSENKVFIGDVNVPYLDDNGSYVTSPIIDLSSYDASDTLHMNFTIFCDTEYNTMSFTDYMLLVYSDNEGVAWDLALINDIDGDGEDEAFPLDEAFLGFYNGEFQESVGYGYQYRFGNEFIYEIPDNFKVNDFKYAFQWYTDNYHDADHVGCIIDDIDIVRYSVADSDTYEYSDGTSMAAPQVAGVAALLLSYEPSLSTAEIKAAILNTGDSLATLDGKTVTGKRVNAQKALESLAPAMDHFVITGANTQQAGNHQEITITAIDSRGDVYEDYDDDYNVTFSGAGVAEDGTRPACSVDGGELVDFGELINLEFEDGVATCDMLLFKKEDASISVKKGEYNADDEKYDLNVSISAGDVSHEDTFISVLPDPAYVGGEAVVTVTAKDEYRNPLAGGGDDVGLLIFNGISEVPVDTDDQGDGTYTATQALTDPVDIIIRGTINSVEIGSDGDGDDNGVYNLEVIPPVMDHFTVSGANTQQAGDVQTVTITAIDSIGNAHTDYAGDKTIVLSGATNALDGTKPTCDDINFGEDVTLTFTDGIATCDMKLYKKESVKIDVMDGVHDSTSDAAWDLDVVVSAGSSDYRASVLSVNPDPTYVGEDTTISVTVKDVFENKLDQGGDTVTASVSGSNENTPSVVDKGNGIYIAIYKPSIEGNDLIVAKLNGTRVSIDTDGIVDARYELEVLKKKDDGDEDEIDNNEIEIEKPSMSLSGKVKRTLSKKSKIYIAQDEIKFKGEVPELSGGKVVIKSKRGSKSDTDETDINSDGSWKEKVKFDKDGTWQVKFTFYDKDGNKVDSMGTYKIKVDTGDPEFTNLPDALNKSKGDTVWFEAKDDERFKKFKVYFNGQIVTIFVKGEDDVVVRGEYKLPVDIVSGVYPMKVKAYDKAGNTMKKELQVTVW